MTQERGSASSSQGREEGQRPVRVVGGLSATTEVVHDVWVLHVCGEVDLASATAFRSVLEAAKVQERSVIIDLTHTWYVDGPGLTTLESVVAATKKCGRPIGIVADRGLHGLLEIVSLASRAQVFSTVPEALTYLTHAAGAP